MKYLNFKFLILSLLVGSSFGMMKALNTAATGMASQEMNVNTISLWKQYIITVDQVRI